MPIIELRGERLHYRDVGSGPPIVFLHGVWMSSRFFEPQIRRFQSTHRVIALDFRSHGMSPDANSGHTLEEYARDVAALIAHLELSRFSIVGWSMGALVMWEYLKLFGIRAVSGCVVVDQSASDYCWSDWATGVVDFSALIRVVRCLQTDGIEFLRSFLPLMFMRPPSNSELDWMIEETSRLRASDASAIFFDQTVRDYREFLSTVNIPTLLCFGRDEKMMPLSAATHLLEALPNAHLEIFEESGHCPFIEEPDRFHGVVSEFLRDLK